MQQLVLRYNVGDEISGSWTVTQPITYASPEQFAVDYEQWCNENAGRNIFSIADYFLGVISNEHLEDYEILTVQEWFAQYSNIHCV